MWNNQTDANGNRTGYFLDLQQNNPNAQIIITQAQPSGTNCAEVNPDGPNPVFEASLISDVILKVTRYKRIGSMAN